MNRRSIGVLLAVLALTVVVGVANNLVNPHRVPWTGRPRILHSDDGDLPESHWKGAIAGVKHGLRELGENGAPIALGGVAVAGLTLAGRRRRLGWGELGEAWFRAGMAGMFAAAAYYKITNPTEFALTVAQYKLLPDALVRPFALWLPALELVTAAGLLLTRFAREMYACLTVMWVMFIIALGQAVFRRLGITCGCFDIAGATTTGEAWFSLLRDLVLLVPTLYFLARAQQRSLFAIVTGTNRAPTG